MNTRALLSVVTLGVLGALCAPASAGNYAVNCGTNGSSGLVQNQLSAMTGTNNTLFVKGTCVGYLEITGFNGLTITGLSLTGSLVVSASTGVSLQNVRVYGDLSSWNHANFSVGNSTVNGYVQITHESTAYFTNVTIPQWSDPTTGGGGSGIICVSHSECNFSNTTVSGVPSSDPATHSIGVTVGSAARLNFASGRISGFDWGVLVWNNATAFFNPDCANLSIDSNPSIGVYVRDGGMVKLEGLSPHDATSACPGSVLIRNNGAYGMLAEGGGLGYLYRAQLAGHAVDGVRVQNGSVVKIRSSTIDAATTSGRSARVKSNAHLWFDEESNGPAAGSALAGPVCVTNSSSVDTDNSSTTLTTVATCTSP
ncbi:MAG TPA: hypothetical protein VNO35_17525 [Steroidobacteraceae bacterium]|nr:hypothetical protein [Steroidobacteraceae bacterium]